MPIQNAAPTLEIETSMPANLYELLKGPRFWNIHSKTALGEELKKHHEQRIPKHFKKGARAVYGYLERKDVTMRRKQFYWRKDPRLDLVRSGVTEAAVEAHATITFSGSLRGGAAGYLQGRLTMKVPYPWHPPKSGSIGPEELEKEITATTETERQEIGHGYHDRLVNLINAYHGPRKLIRYNAQYGASWLT